MLPTEERKKLFNARPIVIVALGLILGLVSVYFKYVAGDCEFVLTLALSLCILIFTPIFYLNDKKKFIKSIVLCVVTLVFMIKGALSLTLTFENFKNADVVEREYVVNGRVDEVTVKENYSRYVVSDVTLTDEEQSVKLGYRLALYVFDGSELFVGDNVTAICSVTNNSLIYESKLAIYNLQNKIKYTASLSDGIFTINGNAKTVFEITREFLRKNLEEGMSKESFALSYAMMVGDSSYMDEDTLTSFRDAGVAHLFAVSGLHVGFLSGAILFLLRKMRIHDYVRLVVLLAILIFYSGVCGFSASSLRAIIMFGVLFFAYANGEKYDMLSSIFASALIILLVMPTQLFSVGFQLSYACVLSLSLLSRRFGRLFSRLPKFISSSLSSVLSVQVGITPLLLLYFGKSSVISVLINILLIPIISFVFVFIFVLVLIGGAFSIPKITLFLPDKITYGINHVITVVDYTPWLIVGISFGMFILTYYAVILLQSGIFNVDKKFKRLLSILLSVVTIVGISAVNVVQNNEVKAYVIDNAKNAITLINKNDVSVLIVNELSFQNSISNVKRALNEVGDDSVEYLFVTASVNAYSVANKFIKTTKTKNIYSPKASYYDYNGYFHTINFYALAVGEKFNIENLGEFSFCFDGNGVLAKIDNCNALFLSTLNDVSNYAFVEPSKYDYVVSSGKINEFAFRYKRDRVISYRKSQYASFVQGNGNAKFIIKNKKFKKITPKIF